MVKTVSTAEARANFGEVLNSVFYTKEPVVVEKKGKAIAVIISPDVFQRLQADDARDWAIIQAVAERNAAHDPDTVMAEVTAEVEAVRQEQAAARHAG